VNREEWLAGRRKGIGGSDVAPILGMSKWASPLDIYLDKRGELEAEDENEAMHWGSVLEPVIRDEYATRTGHLVEYNVEQRAHPKHAFALANLDGLVIRGRSAKPERVLEVKTSRIADGWGEEGTDEVPEAYALQVQHYMWVTGLPVTDIAVLIGGNDFRIYTVEADRELHDMLLDVERDFWQRVLDGNPPEPRSFEEAARRYRRPASATLQASEELLRYHRDLLDVREQLKRLKDVEGSLKSELAKALGDDADTLVAGDTTLATWKLAKGRKSFDRKAFSAAHPDLYREFTTTGAPSRRFLLKDVSP
jgi:putative phage-type endonuclease